MFDNIDSRNHDRRASFMMITKNNLNCVTFENEDARLLILDVVSHTSACLYYYDTDIEITVFIAMKIRERAYRADERDDFYTVSLLDAGHMPVRKPARTRPSLIRLMA